MVKVESTVSVRVKQKPGWGGCGGLGDPVTTAQFWEEFWLQMRSQHHTEPGPGKPTVRSWESNQWGSALHMHLVWIQLFIVSCIQTSPQSYCKDSQIIYSFFFSNLNFRNLFLSFLLVYCS